MTIHGSLANSRYRLDNAIAFERLIDVWAKNAPSLIPQRAGNDEPVRTPFDPNDLAAAFPAWMQRVWIARRSRPSMYATILTGYLHTTCNLHITGGSPELYALTALVTSLWRLSAADIACVHRLTMAETTEARASRRPDFRTINTRQACPRLGQVSPVNSKRDSRRCIGRPCSARRTSNSSDSRPCLQHPHSRSSRVCPASQCS